MEWKNLDNVDKKLISILMEDGRKSLSEIGRSIVKGGMSHVAVSKRLDKLVKGKDNEKPLVKISAGVNLERMGMKILFMALETESFEVTDKILKKYKDCPRMLMIAPVTGRYNLFAVMIAEDTFSLESILGTCSIRTEEGVRRSETWFGNSPAYPEYMPVNLSPDKKHKATCARTCADCRRYASGKCVGCPTSTVYKGTIYASRATEQKRGGQRKG